MTSMNAALKPEQLAAIRQTAENALRKGAEALRKRGGNHLAVVRTPDPGSKSIISRSPAQQLAFDRNLELAEIADERRFITGLINPNLDRGKTLQRRVARLEELKAREEALKNGANPFSKNTQTQTATVETTNPFKNHNITTKTEDAPPSPDEVVAYEEDIMYKYEQPIDTSPEAMARKKARAEMPQSELMLKWGQLNKEAEESERNAAIQGLRDFNQRIQDEAARRKALAVVPQQADKSATKIEPALLNASETDIIKARIAKLEKRLESPNLTTDQFVTLAKEVNRLEAKLSPASPVEMTSHNSGGLINLRQVYLEKAAQEGIDPTLLAPRPFIEHAGVVQTPIKNEDGLKDLVLEKLEKEPTLVEEFAEPTQVGMELPTRMEQDAELIYDPTDAELIEEPIVAVAPQPQPVSVPHSLRLASSTTEPEVPFDDQRTALRWAKGILDKLRGIKPAKEAETTEAQVANAKR